MTENSEQETFSHNCPLKKVLYIPPKGRKFTNVRVTEKPRGLLSRKQVRFHKDFSRGYDIIYSAARTIDFSMHLTLVQKHMQTKTQLYGIIQFHKQAQ